MNCGTQVFYDKKTKIIYIIGEDGITCMPIQSPTAFIVGGGRGRRGPQGANGADGGLASSYQATATDDITTSSTVDVVATGMTLTPPAGTYLVWFSGSAEANQAVFMSIYSNNVQSASSEERISLGNIGDPIPFNCVARVSVNGSETIEGRWRVITGDGSTANMHQRNLLIQETKP